MPETPHQIIPFPLPIHLATFFGNKLSGVSVSFRSGSADDPFALTTRSEIGKYIFSKLTPINGRPKFSQSDFYIQIPKAIKNKSAGQNRPELTFLELTPQAIKEITRKLDSIFRMRMISFINGVESVHESSGKGIPRFRTSAIHAFCEKNKVLYTDKNVTAWKKMHQRQKISDSYSVYGLL